MTLNAKQQHDFSMNVARTKDLINAIKQQFTGKDGVVLLFAGFEQDRVAFKQESSFYYFTGLNEPGLVVMLDLLGRSILYKPNCGDARAKWSSSSVSLAPEHAARIGINEIKTLGNVCAGYQFHPFFPRAEYEHVLAEMSKLVEQGKTIFTLYPDNAHEYVEQRMLLGRLEGFVPGLRDSIVDIAPLVAQQRRIKDMREIEIMYTAIEITAMAQEAAATTIVPDIDECEVQASIEYIFTAAGGCPAFPSIVAGGKNGTVLHYTANASSVKHGDLVVVDIGAQYNHYCADITRTYPVSGTFTKRQRELYNLVLETQEYIANIAKPGFWLNNADHPEKSLNHLAHAYMAQKGYGNYFTHGVGHYLGLDVHDVGSYKTPLQEGDVFTIEPGIYIPQEALGIRIEDDYWMVKDGVVCLSEQLVKKPEDIEAMMKQEDDAQGYEDEDEDNEYEFYDEDDVEA